MSLPALGASSSLPTPVPYKPPAPPQPYLPNVNWASPVAPRDSVNSTSDGPGGATAENQQIQVAAAGAPIPVIYGRVRVAPLVADFLIKSGKLTLLLIWGEGEIDAVESLTMNDAALPGSVTVTHYTGTAGQTVNATLVAAYASVGKTYTDALPGIAYSVVQVPAGTGTGFPEFAGIIKGRKLYDPRTTLTTYSDNPALALADFLSNSIYGLNKTVDWASVVAVANHADEVISSQKRRLIGLSCDSVSSGISWIDTLRTYASCFVVQGESGLKLVADKPASSVSSFGASDVVAKSLRLKKRGIQQIPTVMKVEYTDTSAIPWRTEIAEVLAAGVSGGSTPRRESTVSLPGIQRYSQAYREAVERLNKLTLGDLTCEFDTFDEALSIEVGDVIDVTHPIGLAAKLMRVNAVSAPSPGRWHIMATEYDPAMYSDTVQSEPTYGDTDLPSPADPPAVAGLAAVEEVYQLENGTYSSRIKLAWTAADYPYVQHYRVEVFRLGELVFSSNARDPVARTPAVQEGVEYVCKVATVTTIGAVGDWAQINITPAGKYLVPGDVPSLTCFEAGGTVHVDWLPAIDIDIWRYEVRYSTTAGTWADATMIDRVDALRLTSDQIPVGTWKIHVKALDSVGQYSATAATANVVVTSDAASFFVDSYDSTTPTLTNMASFTLAPTDSATYYVTEDSVAFGTKYSSNLSTYGNALATYHSSLTSTWLGEAEDFGQLLGGQWTGNSTVAAISGSLTSYLGLSPDGSAWTYLTGLSQKENGRFARLKHESLTTSTLLVTVPTQNIRLDAIPREEVGSGTSSAAGPVTVTLENDYVAVKKLTITPQGTTARIAVYDNIVVGNPTTFQVYVFNDAGVKIASNFLFEFQGV
jgi:hypothetical protein